jgi:uncharacterized membrane protein
LSRLAADPRPWLLLLLVAAAWLRVHQIGEHSLWIDELFTLAQTSGAYHESSTLLPLNQVIHPLPPSTTLERAVPWWRIWPLNAGAGHPPLYIILLRGWREACGQDTATARLLSALASTAAVALIFELGRLLYGPLPALWAAAIMAFAGTQIWYAQEIRPYALLVSLALAAAALLLRIERDGPRLPSLLALGACTLALPLVHYFSLGFLAALGIYAATVLQGRARRRVLGACLVAALLFLASWGPFMWQQRHETHFEFLEESGGEHLASTAQRLATLPWRLLIATPHMTFPAPATVTGAFLLLLPLAFARRDRALLLPTLWFWGTVGMIGGMDLFRDTRQLHWIRYTLLAAPPFYLLVAGLLRASPRRWPAAALSASYLAVALIFLPGAYPPVKSGWQGLGRFLEAHAGRDELLVIAPGHYDWYSRTLALGFLHYLTPRERSLLILQPPIPPAAVQELRRRGRFWAIADDPRRFGEIVPEAVLTQGSWARDVGAVFRAEMRRPPD